MRIPNALIPRPTPREPASKRAGVGSLAALAARQTAGQALERLGAALWQRKLAGTPARVLFAPETFAPCDAAVAADIYAGVFSLAGETADAAGQSPFAISPPSRAWAEALHGFAWLIHLEANPSELASSNARALVEEWLGAPSASSAEALLPTVSAQRLTSFLVEAPLLLENADSDFRLRFLRSIGRQMRRLERLAGQLPKNLEKLKVVAALALAGTVVADQLRLQRWALAELSDTIEAQLLPDGGHASRRPDALVAMLEALIPLREALVRRQLQVPPSLSSGIDKMLPMLRFFCHGDGSLAAFHGSRPVAPERLDALAAFDDAKGKATENARYSGFQRLTAGGTTVIVDTGVAPPPRHAAAASASALAFEFSHGTQRLIVNCGALGDARPAWDLAARATAAHSTLGVDDTSAGRFLRIPPLSKVLGPVLYGGPDAMTVRRDGLSVQAVHDGFLPRFGLTHERTLSLSEDGLWLEGADVLKGQERLAGTRFTVRFHLAHGIKVRLDKARKNAMLSLPDGAIWLFSLDEGPVLSVEESIVLVDRRRARRTGQIVIVGNTLTDDVIRWHIARHAPPLSDASEEHP